MKKERVDEEEGSGKSGVLSGPDDSESGDVDDDDYEEGSGTNQIQGEFHVQHIQVMLKWRQNKVETSGV